MSLDSGALAWGRLCQKMVALAVAWAEFKLALDDYALMERGGELPAYPDISVAGPGEVLDVSANQDAWKGVYPGMCIDPDTCRGKTHCPRSYSCCE